MDDDDVGQHQRRHVYSCGYCYRRYDSEHIKGLRWRLNHLLFFCDDDRIREIRDAYIGVLIAKIHPSALEQARREDNVATRRIAEQVLTPAMHRTFQKDTAAMRQVCNEALRSLTANNKAVHNFLRRRGTVQAFDSSVRPSFLVDGAITDKGEHNFRSRATRTFVSPLSFILGGQPLNAVEEVAVHQDPSILAGHSPVVIDVTMCDPPPIKHPKVIGHPSTLQTQLMLSKVAPASQVPAEAIEQQDAKSRTILIATTASVAAFLQIVWPQWIKGLLPFRRPRMEERCNNEVPPLQPQNHQDSERHCDQVTPNAVTGDIRHRQNHAADNDGGDNGNNGDTTGRTSPIPVLTGVENVLDKPFEDEEEMDLLQHTGLVNLEPWWRAADPHSEEDYSDDEDSDIDIIEVVTVDDNTNNNNGDNDNDLETISLQ